jgi:hypothetical protein
MTFRTETKPVPGAQLKQSLDRIEETWAEMEAGDLPAESARSAQRDIFELVGMVKGLMMAMELSGRSPIQSEGEDG